MIFSSLLFLSVFLPLFLVIYFLLPKKQSIKNNFILLASFMFYAWGEPKFVFILFLITIVDFYLVRKMDSYDNPYLRKLFVSFPILINLGLLSYFKYFNFFIDNVNGIGSIFGFQTMEISKIILPIGISFYTFESITYSVDVYRRVHKPLKNFWDYQVYIIYFPKLIAGPIVRFHEIADQLTNHIYYETYKNRVDGFIRFAIGLGKKVLIANAMSRQADAIFAIDNSQLSTAISWMGALAYTLQIYFDFSGYSDMAIGISKMMGFSLPENFNNPYTSKSVTEFWKRWHITLGSWMRNYLYIPLGGNRVDKFRVYINLFIVFLVSGFWHGAGWNFIFWGAYYGVFLVLEKWLLKKGERSAISNYIGWIYTLVVVIVGWVFFRIENIDSAFQYVKKMFAFEFNNDFVFISQPDFFYLFILAVFFSFFAMNRKLRDFQEKLFSGELSKFSTTLLTAMSIVCVVICLVSLSGGQFNPFIYFKF